MRRYFLTFAFMTLTGFGLMAQESGTAFWTPEVVLYVALGLVFLTSILVLIVAIYVLQLLKTFLLKEVSEEQKVKQEAEAGPAFFAKLWAKWNDFKPMEKEEEIILDHDYDGIRELDNHLPPWWKGLFYLTIVYSVIYLLVLHVFQTSPLQEEEYELEIAAAKQLLDAKPQPEVDFDENSVTLSEAPADLLEGKKIFERQCATCHKADGGGMAGPNLTDPYWKHGGGMVNIYKTVKNGIPNTAMISWEAVLNPVRIRQVSSYVMTLQGTNPPGAKGPEGELWEEPETDDRRWTIDDRR